MIVMKKRILSVFLTVAMLLTSAVFVTPTVSAEGDASAVRTTPTPADATGLWTDFAATAFEGDVAYGTEGHGTAENPYKIATPEQLAYLAKLSNEYTAEGKNGTGKDFANEYFVLTDDIDLSAHVWNPISATYTKTAGAKLDGKNTVKLQLAFKGNFDGQGHTVSGITFNDTMLASSKVPVTIGAIGLFGTFSGTMTNLKAEGTAVFADLNSFGATAHKDGAVAIVAGAAIGGAEFENVEVNAFIDITYKKAEIVVGAIAGYTAEGATFAKCQSNGLVTVKGNKVSAVAGGMIGGSFDGSTDLYECVNYATVQVSTTKSGTIVIAGGILGKTHSSADADASQFEMGCGNNITGMLKCINYGAVSVEGPTCKARVGGLIGNAGRGSSTSSGKGDIILEGCINHGAITTNYYHTEAKAAGVCALVGLLEAKEAKITKCLSSTYANCTDATTAANMPNAMVKHLQNKTINGEISSIIDAVVPMGNLFVTPDSGVISVADGARLRLNPSNEKLATLRFDCVLSPNAIEALTGTKIIVGTIIVSADVYAAAAEGTTSVDEAIANLEHGTYRNMKATYGADGVFAALYANITAADYGTEFVAIPYLTIILDERTGDTYNVYDEYVIGDDARTVSVKGIAAQYIEIRSDDAANPNYISGDQLEILESYLNK